MREAGPEVAVLGAGTFLGKELVKRLTGIEPRPKIVLAEPGAESALVEVVGGEWRASTPRVREAIEGVPTILVATFAQLSKLKSTLPFTPIDRCRRVNWWSMARR